MTLMPSYDGYYDDEGNWQQTKHCFISCGTYCTCQAPGGLTYSSEHDKRVEKEIKTIKK